MTLEDETGQANLVVYSEIYGACRAAARDATVMLAEGTIQRQGRIVHLTARRLHELTVPSRDFH